MQRTIDIKWSLWSASPDTIEEYAPGLVAQVLAAYDGTGPAVTIYTGPRKEIRYGTIEVSAGRAWVDMYTEWDNIEEGLCPDDIDPEQVRPFFDYGYGYGDNGEPRGAWVTETVEGVPAADLLARIDAVEEKLLALDREQSNAFDAWCDGIREEANGPADPDADDSVPPFNHNDSTDEQE